MEGGGGGFECVGVWVGVGVWVCGCGCGWVCKHLNICECTGQANEQKKKKIRK